MKYQIAKPYIDKKDIKGIVSVLTSGWLSLGPKYLKFEDLMRRYVKSRYACAVANGTCGLHLAVRALGLKDGDEVITSPFSFISSSNCLLYEKVKPVFVDIDSLTCNMNPALIRKAISKKTKAILVVHIFGQPANMDEIMKIAQEHKLLVIEDACESLGARFKEKMVGTFGDIGVYAFYPNKQMTTGEGGMIVTNSKKLYELCVSLRNQGRNKMNDWLVHERLGYNYRMDEMSASLGVTQLKKIEWMIDQKIYIARMYEKHLHNVHHIMTPQIAPDRTHSWFVYVIRITNGKRNEVMSRLQSMGIQTKPYFSVIHLQPFMKKLFSYSKGEFPIAEQIANETLALPFYIGLKENDIKDISNSIKKMVLSS